MSFILAALFVYSSNLGYGSLYPGVAVGLRSEHVRLEARAAWSRKETPRSSDGHFDYAGWGWSARGDVRGAHVLAGGEVNSEITPLYTKTAWYPKLGAYWQTEHYGEVRIEALGQDSSANKTKGLRLTHGMPEFPRLRMEWEVDRYRPSDGHGPQQTGGRILFSWGMP